MAGCETEQESRKTNLGSGSVARESRRTSPTPASARREIDETNLRSTVPARLMTRAREVVRSGDRYAPHHRTPTRWSAAQDLLPLDLRICRPGRQFRRPASRIRAGSIPEISRLRHSNIKGCRATASEQGKRAVARRPGGRPIEPDGPWALISSRVCTNHRCCPGRSGVVPRSVCRTSGDNSGR
jgi:hypothetical protein